MKPRVVVVGAGLGGLACALRLQAGGCDVTVFERRDRPGGRAYRFEVEGFRFDCGPTIITEPSLIRDTFAVTGRPVSDYVEFVPLDPYYRIQWPDGSVFNYSGSTEAMEREIARFSPTDVPGYRRLLRDTGRIYADAFARLGHEPFLSPLDMIRVLPKLMACWAPLPVYYYVARYFRNRKLRQAFSFHPLFLGGNPFSASTIYSIIPYLEKTGGVWNTRGGTYELVRGYVRAIEELGGRVVTSAMVERIEVRDGRAVAVWVDGERHAADAVVSNADVANTYLRLLDPGPRRRQTEAAIRRRRYTMSCFLLFLGVRGASPHLVHHTILMGPRYRALLDDIFRRKRLFRDPSLYVHRPTASDPDLAPSWCDTFYVLAPVPNLSAGIDWARVARPFRDLIVERVARELRVPDLRRRIVVERCFTPVDFERELGAYLGNAFSVEPTLLQSAWFRPHNRSEELPNLYIVGAGTHPGAGVPGVTLSAKITARLALTDLGLPPDSVAASSRARAAVAAGG